MRRRIAIALLIVSVVGAAVFWLSQPKKGAVEWHKREYLAAKRQLAGETWLTPIYERYYKIRRTSPVRPLRTLNAAEMQVQLKKLGAARRNLVGHGILVRPNIYRVESLFARSWNEGSRNGVEWVFKGTT